MDDEAEVGLRKICCTCLSVNRKLIQLCKVNDGVNILYFLLTHDPEAFKDGFLKDSASLYVCWECRGLIRRIIIFRLQACLAQKLLSSTKVGLPTLSHLTEQHKTTFDHIFTSSSSSLDDHTTDHFIDCNNIDIKTENDDSEDVPLSQLNGFSVLKKNIESSSDQEHCSDQEGIISTNYNKSKRKCCDENLLIKRNKKKKSRKKSLKNKELVIISQGKRKISTKLKERLKSGREAAILDQAAAYKCGECNKFFENKSQRWKHVQRSHKEGHKCDVCNKRFAFRHNLNRHQLVHSDPLPREECEICHKMIRTDLLKVHARIHMQRERFSCDACDKTFVSRASYQHHLKYTMSHSTTDILKHKCSTCDKGYRSRGELRDHENYQHKGRSHHQCPVCGKPLATRRCILRHVRRAHHGVKENKQDKICQQCGKAFRDKKSLREHEFIHTGERPLSCEVCGRTFRQSASLYMHKKRVHKIHAPRKLVQLAEEGTEKNT